MASGRNVGKFSRFIFRLTDQSDRALTVCVFLLLGLGYLLHGCASVSVEIPDDPRIRYVRIGDQQIQGFTAEKDAFGRWNVVLKNQESKDKALDVLKALLEGAK